MLCLTPQAINNFLSVKDIRHCYIPNALPHPTSMWVCNSNNTNIDKRLLVSVVKRQHVRLANHCCRHLLRFSYIRSIAKDMCKMYGSLCWLFILSSISTRARSGRKWFTVIIFEWELLSPHASVSIKFKNVSELLGDELFSTHRPISHRRDVARLSLPYC